MYKNMKIDNMESIINKLNCSSLLEEVILSFKGQSLKLNKSDDGERYILYFNIFINTY